MDEEIRTKVLEDKKWINIEDGKHEGTIISVALRPTASYGEYLDFVVTVDDRDDQGEPLYTYEDAEGETQLCTLTFGLNYYVSPSSQLGVFLSNMGLAIEPGKEVKVNDVVGSRISFQTMTEKVKSKKLGKEIEVNNIIRETIKAL